MLPWSDRKPPAAQRKRPAKPAWLDRQNAAATTPADGPASCPPSKPAEPLKQRDVGRQWEERAAQWLTERGLQPLAFNVASRRGEIDLIFADGDTAVVVEVRRRANAGHGSATESIDWHKRKRIAHTALLWWAQSGSRRFRNLRFDTLTFTDSARPQWIRHAFDAQGSI